jgi:arylsulfatase A-like enzyme
MLYEGGVRVPFIARWTGRTAPGGTSDQPVCSVDLLPTLLDLAGATPPPPDKHPIDGVSIVPLLTGQPDAKLGREDVFWHFPGYLGAGASDWRTKPVGAVRSGDYKLLEFFEDGRLELYNLKDDLSQKVDLAEKDPDRAKALHAKLVAWRESVGAKMPTPNDKPQQPGQRKRKQSRESDDE